MLQLGLSPNSARNLSGVGVRPRNGAYDHSGSICGRRLVASPPPDRSRGFQSAAGAHNRSCSASDDGQDVGRPVEQVHKPAICTGQVMAVPDDICAPAALQQTALIATGHAWRTLRFTLWCTTVARSGSPDSRIHTIVIVGVTAFTIKLAEYFLSCGDRVVITNVDVGKACAAAHELRAAVPDASVLGTCCNPACGESIKKVVDRAHEEGFGNIDLFLPAAGSVSVSQDEDQVVNFAEAVKLATRSRQPAHHAAIFFDISIVGPLRSNTFRLVDATKGFDTILSAQAQINHNSQDHNNAAPRLSVYSVGFAPPDVGSIPTADGLAQQPAEVGDAWLLARKIRAACTTGVGGHCIMQITIKYRLTTDRSRHNCAALECIRSQTAAPAAARVSCATAAGVAYRCIAATDVTQYVSIVIATRQYAQIQAQRRMQRNKKMDLKP